MKNMFESKSDAYTLNAVLEAVDEITNKLFAGELAKDRGVVLNMDLAADDTKQFSIIHDGIDKLATKSRADTFKDIMTRTFGLFDSDMTELNAKRSDLLAKDHVKNYTYKRHYWNAGWYSVEYDNIFAVTNHILTCTRFVIDKNRRSCSAQYAKEIADKEYKAKIDGYIETRLCGWTKGAYSNFLKVHMIGDGKKIVMREMNFQDDWSISDMLDWEQKISKDFLDYWKKMRVASVKDVREQLKKIISDFNAIAKADKANAKIYANEIKRCIKYTTYMMMRLDEFVSATFDCLELQHDEIHKVLEGLLKYEGD